MKMQKKANSKDDSKKGKKKNYGEFLNSKIF